MTPDRETKFQISVQKSRAGVYGVAVGVALLLSFFGLLPTSSYFHIVLPALLGTLSAFALDLLFRLGALSPLPAVPFWLAFDMCLISWGVYVSGGASSLWFPWYLANIGAAAVALGPWAAFLVAVGDTGGYVTALWARGDLGGADDSFQRAVGLMACLYGASFFFLRGVDELLQRRRQVEEMRGDARRQLEELTRLRAEVERRTHEAAEAHLRLSEVDRLKGQFLANMSHELRTPLNSIIGFSGILESHLGTELSERHARFLGHIRSSGEHLLRMINDILDLSRIEAGHLELNVERFSIKSIVDGISSVLIDSARKRGIEVKVELLGELPPIEADVVRVKQILYNLAANAVKFSHDDATVTIRVRHLEAQDSPIGRSSLGIEVEDRGIGIEAKDRELIFQEFHQVDSGTDREFEGTGLGLALVKRFVELHQGIVTVKSAVGKGSTFTVVLPVAHRGEKSGGAGEILVVEDNQQNLELVEFLLEDAGYRVRAAKSAEDVRRELERGLPGLVLMDIQLPGTDGLTLAREIRQRPGAADLPIVALTAHAMRGDRERFLAAGCDGYISKPIHIASFVAEVTSFLRSRD